MADIVNVRLQQEQQNYTLRNTTINPNKIGSMTDVITDDAMKTDGSILVYNAAAGRFELTDIFTKDGTTNKFTINGGRF